MIRYVLLLFFLVPFATHASDLPKILITIKPVHSLVSNLLVDITQPDLLLDGSSSPHSYQLRPSDALKLSKADVIIWMGPTLEDFMQKQLHQIRGKTIIQLTSDNHTHDPQAHLQTDPHRWLDPQLAIADLQHIANNLIFQYPELGTKISLNLSKLINRLKSLDQELIDKLGSNKTLSALLYHDAWHYFTGHFQLSAHGIINPTAHQQPGVRHLAAITKILETRDTRCLLIEPQFKPRYINTLINKYQLKALKVDPLGANQPAGPNAYFDMMHHNADAFAQCL